MLETIYKIDTKGKLRTWRMELDGARYRTIAGVQGGKLVTSEWTVAQPTNEGRANARTAEQQAAFEVDAAYQKKLTREYYKTVEAAGGGAHFFKPMLAQKYQKYEKFQPGFAQPKLDGVRCIANKDGLWSREGKPIKGAPHIHEALQHFFTSYPEAVLDGELYNHDLKDDFNSIISHVKKQNPSAEDLKKSAEAIQYWIYDLPSAACSFAHRHKYLLRHFENELSGYPKLIRVRTDRVDSAAEYDTLHGACLEQGYEGSIFRLDAPYEQKRSKNLLKRKEFVDEEFAVVRIEEGLGNWSGVAKRVVCRLDDGREFGAGIKGSRERAKELLNEKHNVVTVKYFNRTPDGIPRFPVAIKFHGEERTL